jgi:hypothetical protein
MARRQAPQRARTDKDDFEESIRISGVPLVVWAVRLSLFLLLQGAIVLASYAYYGFGTDPDSFSLGFRLDPVHALINLVWGIAGSAIGFFLPRFSIDFALAFAMFFTAFAGFGSFAPDQLGMQLGFADNLVNWTLAAGGWAVSIYALCQETLHAGRKDD